MKALRSRRGQALVILSGALPMILMFSLLMLGGGILIHQTLSLSRATQSSVLAAANQVDGAYYYQTGNTQILATGGEPNTSPCGTYQNQTLCVVLTTLCDSYNNTTATQTDCLNSNSPPATCPSANSSGPAILVYNRTGPACVNSINYWVTETTNQQTATVATWYTFPNPFGDLFVADFQTSSSESATMVAGAVP